MNVRMTVGDVAKVLGMSNESIRYYVREGLIHPEQNPENNYWEYSSEDVLLISDVLFYRDLGISINNIRKIFNGLPLENIRDVIEETKSDIESQMLALSRLHSRLQIWEDAYDEELKEIGIIKAGMMPAFFRNPEYFDEESHIVGHLKNSPTITPDEWMNVSLTFIVNINEDPVSVKHCISLRKSDSTTRTNCGRALVEEKSVPCILTRTHLVEDATQMIQPLIDYSKEQGIAITGEFYGWEQTNYYVNHKRRGIYTIYAPIK